MVEAPSLPEARAFVTANLAQGLPQFVAVRGQQVVGWCDVLPAADPRVHAQRHIGRLGLGLLAALRGQGLGARLLEATLGPAFARFMRVELGVYSHNPRARALYAKAGFVTEGVRRQAWRLDGRTSDIIEMALLASEYSSGWHKRP